MFTCTKTQLLMTCSIDPDIQFIQDTEIYFNKWFALSRNYSYRKNKTVSQKYKILAGNCKLKVFTRKHNSRCANVIQICFTVG